MDAGRELLDAAASLPDKPGHDALMHLAPLLRAVADSLDAATIDAVRGGDPRLILGQHPDGPLLALRWYEPDYRSTVHAHAWAVLLGLAGTGTLERFVLGGEGRAQRHACESTDAPNVAPIDGGEIHRQLAGPDGTVELVVIGEYDPERPHVEFEE